MENTVRDNTAESQQQELYFSINNQTSSQDGDEAWYQNNPDLVFPLFIIGVGLFQFILRKFILPVPDDVISKLSDQFPSQGLIFMPELGLFLIIVGTIMLVAFNI